MLRIAAIVATLVAFRGRARAECVAISGDDELVRPIVAILGERGIVLESACMHVTVARRGDGVAITVDHVDGPIERTVGELETVATVIESFVRDAAMPLLPIRERPAPRVVVVREQAVPQPAPRPPGVQVFTNVETSMGSDHTNWLGGLVGVCITLGPICAAARTRHASVVAGEGVKAEMVRRSSEILLGLDVPFAVGRMTFSPGFAAGIGTMRTKSSDGTKLGETGGLRADVHATLTVGLSAKWALDFSAALDLTQETHTESEMTIPTEPLALLRFGLGLRWGRR